MGFFDLFKTKTETKRTETAPIQTKSFTNIDELLEFNFSDFPNDTYEVTEVVDNGYGDTIRNYQNTEAQNVYNLFDTIEIKKFIGKPNKNFIFSNTRVTNHQKLKELTNNLVQLYGTDHINLGKFNFEDERDIKEGYWRGRSWLDAEKYKSPIMISYDAEIGLSMTVFKTE